MRDASLSLCLRNSAKFRPKPEILSHRELREQRWILESHPDWPLLRWGPSEFLPIQKNSSGAGFIQPGNQPKQSRLPASGWPQQDQQLPVLNLERKSIDRSDTRGAARTGKGLRDVFKEQPGHAEQNQARLSRICSAARRGSFAP